MYTINKNIVITINEIGDYNYLIGDNGNYVDDDAKYFKIIEKLNKSDFSKEKFNSEISILLEIENKDCEVLFENFLKVGFILSSEHKPIKLPKHRWMENGWGISEIFHKSTIFTEFMFGDKKGLEEQIQEINQLKELNGIQVPPAVKEYDETKEIKLKESVDILNKNFFSVLQERRTQRNFSKSNSNNLNDLINILTYASKSNIIRESIFFDTMVKRNVPSGGSMHPVEIYPILFKDLNNVKKGVYHYNHIRHSLNRVNDIKLNELITISQKQIKINKNTFGFIITNRFIRNLYKYRYPKSYLFSLYDVGHFVQNLIMVNQALGYENFLTPALNVNNTMKILQLPNVFDECPVYLVVSGKK